MSDYICEPHAAICSEQRGIVLNLVSAESADSREMVSKIVTQDKPETIMSDLRRIKTFELPERHHVSVGDIHSERLDKIILSTYER